MGAYDLVCIEDGALVDERYTLNCPDGHKGLLRSVYKKKTLDVGPSKGIFKFSDWLPVRTEFETDSSPVVFRSERLSKELGLRNLWVGFTGYYPERGGSVRSCTFKEMEAYPTYARLKDNGGGTIILASAGNTARAFAQTAAETGSSCLIVVPKASADRIEVTDVEDGVRVVAVDGDYSDAIRISERMSTMGPFVPEGGARNVARRDGMGTVMHQCAVTSGRIPDMYFQGVGSGTGGISAWEAAMRLIGDGRFGDRPPKLMLSQNLPFAPMAKAWAAGRRSITQDDLGDDPKRSVSEVYADVLTNRNPPYSMVGGVFDAMSACGGDFITVSNDEARSAEKLWMQIENARPDPAASVALASLIKAAEDGTVSNDEEIFLNMTGGGRDRVKEDHEMISIKPYAEIACDASDEELMEVLNVRVRSRRYPPL